MFSNRPHWKIGQQTQSIVYKSAHTTYTHFTISSSALILKYDKAPNSFRFFIDQTDPFTLFGKVHFEFTWSSPPPHAGGLN
jgi:hypothetical protein